MRNPVIRLLRTVDLIDVQQHSVGEISIGALHVCILYFPSRRLRRNISAHIADTFRGFPNEPRLVGTHLNNSGGSVEYSPAGTADNPRNEDPVFIELRLGPWEPAYFLRLGE